MGVEIIWHARSDRHELSRSRPGDASHQSMNKFDFPVFTLDTGLLFPETLALKANLEDFFKMKIESVEPDLTVEKQADTYGAELWNHDPDLCCTLRKVLPLRDKLTELNCWITGLRRQQSHTRAGIGVVELYSLSDGSGHNMVKLNPMANWSHEAVWPISGNIKSLITLCMTVAIVPSVASRALA